jgi:hypothetical protein
VLFADRDRSFVQEIVAAISDVTMSLANPKRKHFISMPCLTRNVLKEATESV